MSVIVVVDSGGSKTQWNVLGSDYSREIITKGMNPYSSSKSELVEVIDLFKSNLKSDENIEQIFFYGAGCSEPNKVEMIKNAFLENQITEELYINHDLMAAARSLFNENAGIACILGTGSSACYYNGIEIEDKIMSLGYVLGDEGGGMDLGRRLLFGILKKTAPPELIELFYNEFSFSPQQILDKVYFESGAKRFVASFAPFLKSNIDHPYCLNLVESSFKVFIESNLLQYRSRNPKDVGFVGSVGYNFQETIRKLLLEHGFEKCSFIKSPMEGLLKYHQLS